MEKETGVKNLEVSETTINTSVNRVYKVKIDESGLSQIFIPSVENENKVRLTGRICGSFMLDTILRGKVCKASGIRVKDLKQKEGDNFYRLTLLQEEFEKLTGFKNYWNSLQIILDYIATYNYGKSKGYEYDSYTEKQVEEYQEQVDCRLKEAVTNAFLNFGEKGKYQITPREFCKRMGNLRKIIVQEYESKHVVKSIEVSDSEGQSRMALTIVGEAKEIDQPRKQTTRVYGRIPAVHKKEQPSVRVPEVASKVELPVLETTKSWERASFMEVPQQPTIGITAVAEKPRQKHL